MSQMFDLIKQNAVPAAVMRSAAKGALSVPADEMIEILVYLTRNPIFGQEAKMTLAAWDEASALAAVSGPAPQEVLDYFWAEQNRRPRLMPALIENPQVPEQELVHAAAKASRELLTMMMASARVHASGAVLRALLENARLLPLEIERIRAAMGEGTHGEEHEGHEHDPESEAAHQSWHQEHAHEIAAEEGKAFELVGGEEEQEAGQEPVQELVHDAAHEADREPGSMTVEEVKRRKAAARMSVADRKVSTLQRIAKLNVAARVKLAFLGNKEERSILIRDGSKIVQNAVLSSPKLSDPEVETFAAAKNVQENVLREIAHKRRFMKSYAVIRHLVNNPRCPLDISLPLVKNLLVTDLKGLQTNKNVPDTIRKVATKLYKEKSTPPGQRPQ
ncbi:MAG: hypothetical protein LAP21_13435 [Acidobacteriia bacterium]|nr:hypothetical protein [Terriglobia bacterium]